MEPVERADNEPPWRRSLLDADDTILTALEGFETTGRPWLAAAGPGGRLAGILRDVRLRRAILAGVGVDEPVRPFLEPPPIVLAPGEEGGRALEAAGADGAPRVDAESRLLGVEWRADGPEDAGLPAVIMAGGLGRRLRPLTDEQPKPLLRVAGRPLLEHTLPWLSGHGFRAVTLCLNYKAERFREQLGDGSRYGVALEYVRERRRMGTAGPLGLLPRRPGGTLLVLNGDLLTTVNLGAMLRFHREHGAEATMAVCRYDSRSRYGVVQLDGVRIARIEEKPATTSFVNAGIYLLEPTALELLPAGRRYDMPDLFAALAAAGRPTAAFPVYEYWIDIGWLNDLERATADYARLAAGAAGRRFDPHAPDAVDRGTRFGVRGASG